MLENDRKWPETVTQLMLLGIDGAIENDLVHKFVRNLRLCWRHPKQFQVLFSSRVKIQESMDDIFTTLYFNPSLFTIRGTKKRKKFRSYQSINFR